MKRIALTSVLLSVLAATVVDAAAKPPAVCTIHAMRISAAGRTVTTPSVGIPC